MSEKSFSEMFGHQDPETRLALERVQFEDARVMYTLRALGLSGWAHGLRDEERRLTFDNFNAAFPTFPLYLGSSTLRRIPAPWTDPEEGVRLTSANYEIHRDPHSIETVRFRHFEGVPFVFAYRQFARDSQLAAGGRPIGLVVRRKHLLHGLVVHDDDTERYWTQGLSWVYKHLDSSGRPRKLYVLPYQDLIAAIAAAGWRPTK